MRRCGDKLTLVDPDHDVIAGQAIFQRLPGLRPGLFLFARRSAADGPPLPRT
jgi:hypothetical protein